MLPYTTYNIPENPEYNPPDSSKWLWILVNKSLTHEDNQLLEKITGALKADLNKDTYCQEVMIGQTISIAEISAIKPKLIISFGVAPSDVGLWIDLPQSGLTTLESFTFILTNSLDKLSGSNTAKKELWQSMQSYMEKS